MSLVPPHSDDHERATLGAVLILGSIPDELRTLRAADFYSTRHTAIYHAMLRLAGRGEPVDVVMLASELQAEKLEYVEDGPRNRLEQVGGPAYLGELLDDVPRSPNVAHYARRVRDLSRRRALAEAADNLAASARNGVTETDLALIRRDFREMLEADEAEADALHPANLTSIDLASVYDDESIEEPPWVVSQWLCRGERLGIAGEWSAGKSLTVDDLAIGLCRADRAEARFLGALEVRGDRQRVLLIDEENAPALAQRRLQQMAIAQGICRDELAEMPLRYLVRNGINLDDQRGLDAVHRECDAIGPDWIILDSLVRFHRRDENSNTEMAAFFGKAIQPLVEEFGCGLIFLHHLAKPSTNGRRLDIGHRMRGASDIAGFCDQVWGIEREGDARTLVHVKSRWAATAGDLSITIEESLDGDGLRLIGQAPLSQADDVAWGLLTDAGAEGVLRQDVVAAIRAAGIQHASKATTRTLGRYHGQGKARKRKEGKSTRYWRSPFAPEESE